MSFGRFGMNIEMEDIGLFALYLIIPFTDVNDRITQYITHSSFNDKRSGRSH